MNKEEDELSKATDLPFFHRLLLKIPVPGYFNWLANRRFMVAVFLFGLTLSGLAVVFMLPITIMVYTYPYVGFPLNVILGFSLPAFVIVLWLRVQLERGYDFLKTLQRQPTPWDVEKVVKDYLELFDKPQVVDDTKE